MEARMMGLLGDRVLRWEFRTRASCLILVSTLTLNGLGCASVGRVPVAEDQEARPRGEPTVTPGAAATSPGDEGGDVGDAGAEEEEESIITDRPDFTEASTTVGKGRVQLEGGYTFSTDKDGQTRASVH